jgi:diketogulonate reductase-like aldo/keto reductase
MHPSILYGTAWKEDETKRLVETALAAGFRGIDTANQRKHYHEAAVGEALRSAAIPRDELFLQTKFTHVEGQDARLPYDPRAPFAEQVRQSFESSLEHLGVTFLDSLLLHGPRTRTGFSREDREVWEAMEALHDERKVLAIGASNVSAEQLETICSVARVKPAFVQNRCYARTGWDRDVREICRRKGITYQGFSLLTANRKELSGSAVKEIAASHGKSVAQVVLRFAQQVGMLPLTGTTDPQHMQDDLDLADLVLSPEEVRKIETIAG